MFTPWVWINWLANRWEAPTLDAPARNDVYCYRLWWTTRSGKIVELAVRNIVHGAPVKNIEALANPEALDYFRDRVELKD